MKPYSTEKPLCGFRRIKPRTAKNITHRKLLKEFFSDAFCRIKTVKYKNW